MTFPKTSNKGELTYKNSRRPNGSTGNGGSRPKGLFLLGGVSMNRLEVLRQESRVSVLSSICYVSLIFFFMCGGPTCDPVYGAEKEYTVDEIVEAIFHAEGGDNAEYPYGIRSVKCNTKTECQRICANTVRNNLKRYSEYGHRRHSNYLEFLASRYAPVGVSNDHKGLNKNWLKNVRYFLARSK